jgi:hypothetical protein
MEGRLIFKRKVHLVDSLKANLLIGIDIGAQGMETLWDGRLITPALMEGQQWMGGSTIKTF